MADLRDIAGEAAYRASMVSVAPDGMTYKRFRAPDAMSYDEAYAQVFAESVAFMEGADTPTSTEASGYPANRANVLGRMRENKLSQWAVYLAELEQEREAAEAIYGDDAERFLWTDYGTLEPPDDLDDDDAQENPRPPRPCVAFAIAAAMFILSRYLRR